MIKSLGDRLVTRVETTVDDEFERAVLHRSSSVFAQISVAATMVGMVVLAWALPGWLSLWSSLLIVPLLLAEMIAQTWLRSQVASPRASRMSVRTVIALAVFTVAWAAGVQYQTSGLSDGFGGGALTGAMLGLLATLIFGPRIMQNNRARDAERLAAAEED